MTGKPDMLQFTGLQRVRHSLMTEQQQDPAPRQQFQQMFKEDEDRGMQITQWKSIPKCKSSQYQSPPAGELLEFSKNQKEVSVATEEGERGRIKGNC